MPKPGFPCIFFNDALRKCSVCAGGWKLSQGRCFQLNTCPEGQYVRLGQCYDVIANCVDFQFYGGLCSSCTAGFTLGNKEDGTQECQEDLPTCPAGEYLLEKVCKKYVPFCTDFDTLTATCSKCKDGYNLDNNKCVEAGQAASVCPTGQQMLTDGSCRVVDNCVLADSATGWCMVCMDGYTTQGVCVRI